MAISRLQASLASATSEVTVAAANLNFDFTLVKLEAPKEYQALGSALSSRRKDNAEHGSSHKTARQLGALFEGVCPATPKLLEAYGIRASEIAKASEGKSEPYIKTLFGEYAGIDGTSIWAAATSSKSALHVHLLACMLARMWSAQEAVAIWVELVKERKQDVAQKLDGDHGISFSLAAAVGQDITRPQLAAWDASARAWLRTADDIFLRKQKQLELIIKNLSLPVVGDEKVFSSVLAAWSTAVTTMEHLINGMPQAVQNGATVLGLSAWHLYPDMTVFGSDIVQVTMDDPLIACGGALSLGLSATPRTGDDNLGVYWSLSLAQLRYYGRPVRTERVLESNTRIPFTQLVVVVFSAILTLWEIPDAEADAAARVVSSLADCFTSTHRGSSADRRMVRLLKDGATAFLERYTGDQSLNRKLIQLGRRRAEQFFYKDKKMQDAKRLPSLFGLLDSTLFLNSLKDHNARLLFLRHVAAGLPNPALSPESFLIRYWIEAPDVSNLAWAFATALPWPRGSRNTTSSSVKQRGIKKRADHRNRSSRSTGNAHTLATASYHSLQLGTHSASPGTDPRHHRWLPHAYDEASTSAEESHSIAADSGFQSWDDTIYLPPDRTYKYLFGDAKSAALYATPEGGSHYRYSDTVSFEDFQWCLERGLLSHTVLEGLLCQPDNANRILRNTLQVLAFAAIVYDDLPDVTVDVGIFGRSLLETHWARMMRNTFDEIRAPLQRPPQGPLQGLLQGEPDNCAIVFSLLSYFESGIYDVDPKQLDGVIALSSANSLFVPLSIIQDPLDSLRGPSGIRRILGNVGKPGITFLLPPSNPMVRDVDPSTWKVDPYRPFDGTSAMCFRGTSVHLSFTDYHVPVYDGSRGTHDTQVSFLEAVVSVRDKGEWVADLDVLALLPDPQRFRGVLRILDPQHFCTHSKKEAPIREMIAVDSWNELLDPPYGSFVVRTGGNWIARFAASVVALQNMKNNSNPFAITVCPAEVCWRCIPEHFSCHAYIF